MYWFKFILLITRFVGVQNNRNMLCSSHKNLSFYVLLFIFSSSISVLTSLYSSHSFPRCHFHCLSLAICFDCLHFFPWNEWTIPKILKLFWLTKEKNTKAKENQTRRIYKNEERLLVKEISISACYLESRWKAMAVAVAMGDVVLWKSKKRQRQHQQSHQQWQNFYTRRMNHCIYSDCIHLAWVYCEVCATATEQSSTLCCVDVIVSVRVRVLVLALTVFANFSALCLYCRAFSWLLTISLAFFSVVQFNLTLG